MLQLKTSLLSSSFSYPLNDGDRRSHIHFLDHKRPTRTPRVKGYKLEKGHNEPVLLLRLPITHKFYVHPYISVWGSKPFRDISLKYYVVKRKFQATAPTVIAKAKSSSMLSSSATSGEKSDTVEESKNQTMRPQPHPQPQQQPYEN